MEDGHTPWRVRYIVSKGIARLRERRIVLYEQIYRVVENKLVEELPVGRWLIYGNTQAVKLCRGEIGLHLC